MVISNLLLTKIHKSTMLRLETTYESIFIDIWKTVLDLGNFFMVFA